MSKSFTHLFIFAFVVIAFNSCSVMIPLQTNLSDQTMLLAENRNIKANYTLESYIHNGFIPYVAVQKNGVEKTQNNSYKYDTETAFTKVWDSYFTNKFNPYSKDQMDVEITLKFITLKEQAMTSIGYTLFTGTERMNMEAVAIFNFLVDYHGQVYEKEIEVVASDYNESQQISSGDNYYTKRLTNPTQQKAILLETCFNNSIIQFENFLRMIMMTDKERE